MQSPAGLLALEYPREIELVSDLPMLTAGKIIRHELREMACREAG